MEPALSLPKGWGVPKCGARARRDYLGNPHLAPRYAHSYDQDRLTGPPYIARPRLLLATMASYLVARELGMQRVIGIDVRSGQRSTRNMPLARIARARKSGMQRIARFDVTHSAGASDRSVCCTLGTEVAWMQRVGESFKKILLLKKS